MRCASRAEAMSAPGVDQSEGGSRGGRMAAGECGYCGGAILAGSKRLPLECCKCRGLYHVGCLRGEHRPSLLGDQLFVFTCALCDPMGEEQCLRPNLQWVHVIHLALYNLVTSGKGKGKKGFFRWNDDICGYIQSNWSELMPQRRKTQSWHSTVAGTLSVNCPSVFQSGFKLFGEHGWWSLTKIVPPDPRTVLGSGLAAKRSAAFQPAEPIPKRPRTSEGGGGGGGGGGEKAKRSQSIRMPVSTDQTLSSSTPHGRKGKFQLELQPSDTLVSLSERQERLLLEHLSRYPSAVDDNPRARRLTRKLKVRALQRNYSMKPFDLDGYVRKCLANTVKYVVDDSKPYYEQIIPLVYPESSSLSTDENTPHENTAQDESSPICTETLSRFSSIPLLSQPLAPQPSRFLHYLTGGSFSQQPISSPYTARSLKPFIFRSLEIHPPRVKLLEGVVEHARSKGGQPVDKYVRKSVDFCYLQQHHLPAVNALVSHFFWPVDLSECLQYPDFTVVVLYGELVIGCGFMTPDVKVNEAYISFLIVHPDFRRCGIGKLMLYHLIQTCMGKDVTLHVSVDNPAMLLYQKFGFKTEQYCLDFYDRYYPKDHHMSKHAYFMRLRK